MNQHEKYLQTCEILNETSFGKFIPRSLTGTRRMVRRVLTGGRKVIQATGKTGVNPEVYMQKARQM